MGNEKAREWNIHWLRW